ncbi:hypothetical protein BN971_02037 [Mycobacterium bohemicum DSM 44277]|uniref:Uncharacterized protein n=1 Tax=Mycobacterium bohemicum DSM 44277 TaxID=1236609 RepID=A0A0U0W6U4_MYCBE|nr:hypothetical protein BN971_02037 [Mycobacterium bohemicum DSM 44277]
MVAPTVASRCWASPSRVSGGSDWLNARSMSSRRGAVYCVPVSPVRSSVVRAEVRPHRRPTWAAMPAVTSSEKRPRADGRSPAGSCGWARGVASAMSAGRGRGTARPEWMVVARAVSITCASSARKSHVGGGTSSWVRGAASRCSGCQKMEPSASWRRAVAESWASRTASEGSR